MSILFQTAVHCGRIDGWRILNLNLGKLYARFESTQIAALDAIEDGKQHDGMVVKRIPFIEIHKILEKQVGITEIVDVESLTPGERFVCVNAMGTDHVVYKRIDNDCGYIPRDLTPILLEKENRIVVTHPTTKVRRI